MVLLLAIISSCYWSLLRVVIFRWFPVLCFEGTGFQAVNYYISAVRSDLFLIWHSTPFYMLWGRSFNWFPLTWAALTKEKCALKIYSKLRHKYLKQSVNRQILLSLNYCTALCQYLSSQDGHKSKAELFSERNLQESEL